MAKMTTDEKLGFTKFNTDNDHSHIEVEENCKNEKLIARLVNACPAGLYKYEDGKVVFNHEGCLECGTCRVLAGGEIIKSWTHPVDGYGVDYRQG